MRRWSRNNHTQQEPNYSQGKMRRWSVACGNGVSGGKNPIQDQINNDTVQEAKTTCFILINEEGVKIKLDQMLYYVFYSNQ
jgi:hypothetical protein